MSHVKTQLRSYYDRIQDYSKGYESKAGQHFKKRKVITFLTMAAHPLSPVLEVGCADGPYTLEFANRRFPVTGSDLSQTQLEKLKTFSKKSNLDNIDLVLADAEHLPFKSASFNMVASLSTVRYIPDPQRALNEFSRITATGGSVVVDFPNKYSPYFLFLKRLFMAPHPHDRHFSITEARHLFETTNLTPISCKTILITPKTAPDACLPALVFFERIIEATPILNRLASIIVCSGRKAHQIDQN